MAKPGQEKPGDPKKPSGNVPQWACFTIPRAPFNNTIVRSRLGRFEVDLSCVGRLGCQLVSRALAKAPLSLCARRPQKPLGRRAFDPGHAPDSKCWFRGQAQAGGNRDSVPAGWPVLEITLDPRCHPPAAQRLPPFQSGAGSESSLSIKPSASPSLGRPFPPPSGRAFSIDRSASSMRCRTDRSRTGGCS